MGVELHITRAEHWSENDDQQIGVDEWLAYVASDPELRLWPENGPHFVRWLGKSAYEEPWLEWSQGNIDSKWPDSALYCKMLEIARALGAKVQDDDGTCYSTVGEWQFDPNAPRVPVPQLSKPWWRRLFS
jgi:hypothetical protein